MNDKMHDNKTIARKGSPALKEHQEKLLLQFLDGECGFFSRMEARRLLDGDVAARRFVDSARITTDKLNDCCAGLCCGEQIWDKVSSRIDQEERSELLLGKRRIVHSYSRMGKVLFAIENWRGPGLFGAVATACVMLLVWQSGFSNWQQTTAPGHPVSSREAGPVGAQDGNIVPARLARPSGIVRQSRKEIMTDERAPYTPPQIVEDRVLDVFEVDWMRSRGRVRLMRDPEAGSTIIWIKKRRPISADAGNLTEAGGAGRTFRPAAPFVIPALMR